MIDQLWARYAEHIRYQIPAGLGGQIALRVPIPLMAEDAFRQACRALMEALAQ